MAGEIAAAEQFALGGVDPLLPALHRGIVGQAVLEDVQCAGRFQDTVQFAQRLVVVGDGAQAEGGDGAVDGVVAEVDRLAVEADELDGEWGFGNALVGQFDGAGGRFDDEQAGDRGRVETQIGARSETDFQHRSMGGADRRGTKFVEIAGAAQLVDEHR